MLWIVNELDDIAMTVGGFDQMGLCSSAHLADEPAGSDGHRLRSGSEALYFSDRHRSWSENKTIFGK